MLVLLMGGIYEVCHWNWLGCHGIIQIFIMVSSGIKIMLRFCISSFGGCNVGITDMNL
jgi:hypothetical protein